MSGMVARTWPAGRLATNCSNDGKGLQHFVDAHLHAAQHVAFLVDRHGKLDPVIGGVREIATEVMVETGGASGNSDDTEILGGLRFEDAGGFQAVAGGG